MAQHVLEEAPEGSIAKWKQLWESFRLNPTPGAPRGG
jgi:hypothetical protein